MKLCVLLSTAFGGITPSAPGDCVWVGGNSGDHLDCQTGQYIDGICGSGSRKDCRLVDEDGATYEKVSFGIHI